MLLLPRLELELIYKAATATAVVRFWALSMFQCFYFYLGLVMNQVMAAAFEEETRAVQWIEKEQGKKIASDVCSVPHDHTPIRLFFWHVLGGPICSIFYIIYVYHIFYITVHIMNYTQYTKYHILCIISFVLYFTLFNKAYYISFMLYI